MPIFTSRLESIVFTPQFDLTKDLVVTIDYSFVCIPDGTHTGGFLIGLYDNTPPLSTISGESSYRGLGYAPDVSTGAVGVANGLLGLGIDLAGIFYNNATGYPARVNSVTLLDSTTNGFAVLTATPTLNTIKLYSPTPVRLRYRITDLGNTAILDYYNFTTNQFSNIFSYTGTMNLTAGGVYIAYSCNSNQKMYISNINLNGMFTDSYILSSTRIPS